MEHWLESVYRDHAAALFRFLMRLTGREADARDVMQDLFVRLAKSPRMLEDVAAPRSFLFRMAHRLVIDRHRREKVREETIERAAVEMELTAGPALIDDEAIWRQASVSAALEALPLEQKAVVALKVWEELTFAEIAGRARHLPQHSRKPLPLRPRQIARRAASSSRRPAMNDETKVARALRARGSVRNASTLQVRNYNRAPSHGVRRLPRLP